MTEAMQNLSRKLGISMSAGGRASEERARAANGAALRWTPGPDELRLPHTEPNPVSQNIHQFVAVVDCFDSLRRHWRDRLDVFVGSDQFVHWDPAYHSRRNPTNAPPSPDLYVAFGVAKRQRLSYVVWEEGKPPDFVLEIVSPSSKRRDRVEKPALYAKMGVPEFFLYDPERKRTPVLSGFELQDGNYVPLPGEMLTEGVVGVRSKMLGLCLCIRSAGADIFRRCAVLVRPGDGRVPADEPRARRRRAAGGGKGGSVCCKGRSVRSKGGSVRSKGGGAGGADREDAPPVLTETVSSHWLSPAPENLLAGLQPP